MEIVNNFDFRALEKVDPPVMRKWEGKLFGKKKGDSAENPRRGGFPAKTLAIVEENGYNIQSIVLCAFRHFVPRPL